MGGSGSAKFARSRPAGENSDAGDATAQSDLLETPIRVRTTAPRGSVLRDEPIQTIRLSPRDRRKLVDAINARGNAASVNSERRNVRVEFHREGVVVIITPPNGMSVKHSVVTRNLSRWGLAFVHGQYVHPESACDLSIPTLDGNLYSVKGTVVRCRHIEGIVHEVSVMFQEPVELDLLVALTDEQRERNALERDEDHAHSELDVNEAAVRRAMVVDDVRSDRKLIALYLTDMGLKAIEAVGAAQAMNIVMRDPVDLIVVDQRLAEFSGPDLVQRMRDEGVKSTIVAVSADDREQIKTQMLEAGSNAFLVKPFTRDALKEVVEDLLALPHDAADDDEPVFSTLADEQTMRPIIADFVSELGGYMAKLHQANSEEDHKQLLSICQQLKGGGAAIGFEQITASAKQAMEFLDAEERDADQIRRTVNELISLLRRVRFE